MTTESVRPGTRGRARPSVVCPSRRRGRWTSCPQAGGPLDNLLAATVLAWCLLLTVIGMAMAPETTRTELR